MKDFNYRKRAVLYFTFVLALLAGVIILFHRQTERNFQTERFYREMENYADIIDNAIKQETLDSIDNGTEEARFAYPLQQIIKLLPSDLRITVILSSGKVVFDNEVNSKQIESHKDRSEVLQAWDKGDGKAIRKSATLDRDFCYYAKRYDLSPSEQYYIRVALPYEIHYSSIFYHSNFSIYFIFILFALGLPALLFFTGRISRSLNTLKAFVVKANRTGDFEAIHFPKNEIGELSNEIRNTFIMLQQSKQKAQLEREKLLSHFSHSGEGIAFFSSQREFIYANSHFIRYLNKIVDEPTYQLDNKILDLPAFKPLTENNQQGNSSLFKYTLENDGSNIEVRSQLFNDGSFEIVLDDVTKAEQNRRLKYEMTNSIAHELRTPVSCVRGYIETLLENPEMDKEKKLYFLERSYSQLIRLSELISDVSTLTKLEEAADLYPKTELLLSYTLEEVEKDLEEQLKKEDMTLLNKLSPNTKVYGNSTLLYTIFRNLIENSIKYAGRGTTIEISSPMEDNEFQYFVVADNGEGVHDKVALEKLFERFYRIKEGRSRADGGSGLGLSIVKNAILLHGGEVQAKQRPSGGLEIFFSLARKEQETTQGKES